MLTCSHISRTVSHVPKYETLQYIKLSGEAIHAHQSNLGVDIWPLDLKHQTFRPVPHDILDILDR